MDHNCKSSEKQIQLLRVENQSILDQLGILRLKCNTFEEDTRSSNDRFSCLKLLVKRAWCGDHEASLHVANIVGVAPPIFEYRDGEDEIVAIPKSRAVNNWASLSAGLLERFYKQREDVMFLKKREFLMERESYLDTQLNGYINDERCRDLDVIWAVNKESSNFEEASSYQQHQHISPLCSRPSFKKLNNQKSQMRVVPVTVGNNNHYSNNNGSNMDEIQSSEYLAIEPATLNGDRNIEAYIRKEFDSKRRPTSGKVKYKSSSSKAQETRPDSAVVSCSKPVEKKKPSSAINNIDRHQSAKIVSHRMKMSHTKQRPFSAHVMGVKYFPAQTSSQTTGGKVFSSCERKRQLDAVEKKLRKTTALLQKKLSINPLNFVT